MGDHHQLGDAAAVDEAGQLVGQAAGGLRLPHVLGEIAVDDHVVAAVGQALAHGVDDRRLPVVLGGIGLRARAVLPVAVLRIASLPRQQIPPARLWADAGCECA
ncbi:hypothetical protein G6F62_014996 [Rhizopus arrhizus]|nr:hypothetical protein G6F62_014996 [Rhizopus arrhizus]